jgi:hypothetical protein
MVIGRTDSVRTTGACRELGANRAQTCRIAAWRRRSIHPVDDDRHIPDRESATTSDATVPHVTIGRRVGSCVPEIVTMISFLQQAGETLNRLWFSYDSSSGHIEAGFGQEHT